MQTNQGSSLQGKKVAIAFDDALLKELTQGDEGVGENVRNVQEEPGSRLTG